LKELGIACSRCGDAVPKTSLTCTPSGTKLDLNPADLCKDSEVLKFALWSALKSDHSFVQSEECSAPLVVNEISVSLSAACTGYQHRASGFVKPLA
jgi:hypothetical protein